METPQDPDFLGPHLRWQQVTNYLDLVENFLSFTSFVLPLRATKQRNEPLWKIFPSGSTNETACAIGQGGVRRQLPRGDTRFNRVGRRHRLNWSQCATEP